jgi:hypothetical protein
VVAMVRVELWPAVTEPGVNVSVVPLGAPVAVKATVWALPEVMLVAMVVTACCPAVAVTEFGVAVRAKSLTTGAAALKNAMPADQYMELGKVAEKVCGAVVANVWKPLMTVTVELAMVFCCGPTVYPGDCTEIAWAFE